MKAEGLLEFNFYLFIISLCLIRHIDVSYKNNENDSYCSLRGRGVGDSKGGTPRESLNRTKRALGHTDGTRARTHGLHDMCGVHLVAATAWGLVQPTSSPRKHKGTYTLCGELAEEVIGAMSWPNRALNSNWLAPMMPTHSTRVQCPMHQNGSTMGTMPWLGDMELDLTVEASNTPRLWTLRHGMSSHISVGKAHWCIGHLVSWLVHAARFRRPWSKTR